MDKNTLTKIIIFSVLGLLLIGILIMADVSAPFSLKHYEGDSYYRLRSHILYILIGIGLAFLLTKIKMQRIKKYTEIGTIIWFFAMFAVFISNINISSGGASRWLNLGIVSIQPSEFFKIFLILFLAKKFAAEKIKSFKGDGLKIISAFGILMLPIIVQKDMSTIGVLGFLFVIMYFLSDAPWQHVLIIILLGLLLVGGMILAEPYRMKRIDLFLNPDLDPLGHGMQQKQSLISIGSGGLTGVGLGMSRQKMGFLPQPMTDSIFPIICEDIGFLGALVILLLYASFLYAGFKIASMTKDKFKRLTAYGIVLSICIQVYINILSAVGLLPVTGLPLPFISLGGSALIAYIASVGILINISKD